MSEKYWSGKQIASIVGVSYDTLDYWVKNEIITPDVVVVGTKKKHRVFYSFSNLVAVAAIKELRDRGISLQRIKKAQKEFCKRIGLSFDQGLSGGIIVADGNDILAVLYTFDEAVEIMSLLRGGQLILPLDTIIKQVSHRVELIYGDQDAILASPLPQLQGANDGY